MSSRVTIKEVNAVWETTCEYVADLGLLKPGDRLVLCEGNAYRFWQVALIRQGTSGHSDPREAGLPQYLGNSKREAVQTLRGVNIALSTCLRRQKTIEDSGRIGAPLL